MAALAVPVSSASRLPAPDQMPPQAMRASTGLTPHAYQIDLRINAARERLGEVLDQARAMDDVDFQLNCEDLAQDLEFLDRKAQLEKDLTNVVGEEDTVLQKIKQFLLDPAIIPLLEERKKQLQS